MSRTIFINKIFFIEAEEIVTTRYSQKWGGHLNETSGNYSQLLNRTVQGKRII